MTQAVGATSLTAPVQPDSRIAAELPKTALSGAYVAGDQLQTSGVATKPKKTLAGQLAEVGQVHEGSGLASKIFNWMNKPKVEAAREYGSAVLHNGPALLIELSKKGAAAAGEAAVVGEVGVAGTAAAGSAMSQAGAATVKAAGKLGSSGFMAVLAKVGAVTGSIGGVIQLLRDAVQSKVSPPSKTEKALLLGGGFFAATGSVIALCGAAFPGAIIGLCGMLVHATGLMKKAFRQDEEHINETIDPNRFAA